MGLNKVILLFIFTSVVNIALAQENRYVVYFTDKAGSEFSVDEPRKFLSERALERRAKNDIEINDDDLPVNPWYLDSLRKKGAEVYFTSKWFNAALIQATQEEVELIKAIKVTDSVVFAAPGDKLLPSRVKKQLLMQSSKTENQNLFHNVDGMHHGGFMGEGLWIAVMDGGFMSVDTIPAFQHLFADGKIMMAKNFVSNDENVFQYDDHGTMVLSLISGQIPDEFTGIAHGANIGLFITEETPTEYRIEEYNWLFAAEVADSAGFDIINTSLGYSTFDDPSMNYTYDDMNGNTAVITKASNMASNRGMLVVTSAGNYGNTPWKYITAPGDAFNNITVGAVDYTGIKAGFSSFGPTADGRIKPDLSALGAGVTVINGSGKIRTANGTSFSAPIVTALAAGIWEQFPTLTTTELREKLYQWTTQPENPDNLIGRGILKYDVAAEVTAASSKFADVRIYPNPARDFIYVNSKNPVSEIQLVDISGSAQIVRFENNKIDVRHLPAGIYLLRLNVQDHILNFRIIKE